MALGVGRHRPLFFQALSFFPLISIKLVIKHIAFYKSEIFTYVIQCHFIGFNVNFINDNERKD